MRIWIFENLNMIEKLHIKNFTCFADNEFEFSDGINVFIGENGTGKTHLLKLLLWNLNYFKNGIQDGADIGTKGLWPLMFTFGVQDINSLKRDINFNFEIALTINGKSSVLGKGDWGDLDFNKGSEVAEKKVPYYILKEAKNKKNIFIPSREILSFFNGFLALYNRREVSFDATYQMLAESLDLPPLRYELAKELGLFDFITELRDILQADVVKENGHFYLKTDTSKIEMNLVAEGWRKIATLIYLILNGELELSKNMVLLIDEPEANLNPKLIGAMAKFLVKMANKGVQIFIATHDYLLSQMLSWNTEYKDKIENPAAVRFFGLAKIEDDGINVEVADSITELKNNPLLESYLDYYRTEEKQFIYK